MTAVFQPPPTYAEVVVFDADGKRPRFNPIWLKWFLDVTALLTATGGGPGGAVVHNSTSGKQGGTANEYFHLTSAQATALIAGFTGTGNIVRQTSPTLVTPILGTAAATKVTTSTVTAALSTSASLNNGAAASLGTLTNSPTAGNPTKWIPIDDNGTTRYLPAW